MLKKTILLLMALLFAVGSHLRPCYDYTIGGVPIAAGFAPGAARQAELAVLDAAEEILRESASLPAFQKHLRLRFKRPSEDMRVLTDALLRSTEGIAVSDEVIVNGTRLGTVEDGRRLCQALESSIRIQMPMAAVSGSISGRLELRRVYTRAGQDTPTSDMVLLITGMAPVIYVDSDGKLA